MVDYFTNMGMCWKVLMQFLFYLKKVH